MITELITLSEKAIQLYDHERYTEAKPVLIKICKLVVGNPESLQVLTDTAKVGRAFLLMLDVKITSDIDTLQMIASIGYLLISQMIKNDPHNINAYKDRLFLLNIGKEGFYFTAKYALFSDAGYLEQMDILFRKKVEDSIYLMEVADFETFPIIPEYVPYLKNRRMQLQQMIEKKRFNPLLTNQEIFEQGIENHKAVFDYLEAKIIKEKDLNF